MRRLVLEKAPLLALAAASGLATLLAQQAGGAVRTMQEIPPLPRVANALIAYVSYLGKTLWPACPWSFRTRRSSRVGTRCE